MTHPQYTQLHDELIVTPRILRYNHLMSLTGSHSTTTLSDLTTALQLPCNICNVSDLSEALHAHRRSSWHIYNLQRRVASLTPISLENYDQLQDDLDQICQETEEVEDIVPTHPCLFCNMRPHDEHSSLTHMRSKHGFSIVNAASIIDVGCFLQYLTTVVHEWSECLYCGITKSDTNAVQSHMRDRGHCQINVEREPELLDFWDTTEATSIDTAIYIPMLRRAASTRSTSITIRQMQMLPQRSLPNSHNLGRRDMMGLQDVGPHQHRTLVAAIKKAQQAASTASQSTGWIVATKANKQKHDQAHGALSWAKGGLHNLLPR